MNTIVNNNNVYSKATITNPCNFTNLIPYMTHFWSGPSLNMLYDIQIPNDQAKLGG